MAEYTFTEKELAELRDIFFAEAYEMQQLLDSEVLGLEAGSAGDDALRNIQRHLHTLKGNSRALGFPALNVLCHKSEDLLKTVQDNSLNADGDIVDILFDVNDSILHYLDSYRSGAEAAPDEGLMKRIEACMAAPQKGNGKGGRVITSSTSQERKSRDASEEAASTLRVESRRVDKILNLVGELVIGRSIIGQTLYEMGAMRRKDDLVKRLGDANAFMEKTLSQLQKNVMKMRMLPISQVFKKFPRVVRDLAVEKGKEAELVTEGEKTELDKSILDAIGEPLIHLIRNAVDHGIEPPDERERAGKPRKGTITLKASHEGNQIAIEITDDGRGLDAEMIRKKAVEKGIAAQEEIEKMSDQETYELIFLTGFSTAETVTDISGRGMGMDIVKTAVESLKGRIHLKSAKCAGCTVALRLPLTLAIIKAMIFTVGGRLYALPLSSIEKIMRVREGTIQTIGGKEALRHRDRVISLISLREALSVHEKAPENGKAYVIIVGLAEKNYGFKVDGLLGQQELVIKSIDDYWGSAKCASGASILGSGRVVLILDAPSIVSAEINKEAGRAEAA